MSIGAGIFKQLIFIFALTFCAERNGFLQKEPDSPSRYRETSSFQETYTWKEEKREESKSSGETEVVGTSDWPKQVVIERLPELYTPLGEASFSKSLLQEVAEKFLPPKRSNGALKTALEVQPVQPFMQALGTMLPWMRSKLDMGYGQILHSPGQCHEEPQEHLHEYCRAEPMELERNLGRLVVGRESQRTVSEKKKETFKIQRQRKMGTARRKGTRRREGFRSWQRCLAYAWMVCTTSASSATFSEGYGITGSCPFICTAQRIGGTDQVEAVSQGTEAKWPRFLPRRDSSSLRNGRQHNWAGRHSHIQKFSVEPWCGEERTRVHNFSLEGIQILVDGLWSTNARLVGKACEVIRGRRTRISEAKTECNSKSGRGQGESARNARKSYCIARGEDRAGLGGREHERRHWPGCHSGEKDQNSNGRGNCDHERAARGYLAKTETKSGGGSECGTSAAPSIGRTARVPEGMQDRPPRKSMSNSKVLTWSDAWNSEKVKTGDFETDSRMPWNHSVTTEADYKSPMMAELQGFLMSQSFYDLEYNDRLQSFEISNVSPEAWKEQPAQTQAKALTVLESTIQDVNDEILFDLMHEEALRSIEVTLYFSDFANVLHERKRDIDLDELKHERGLLLTVQAFVQEQQWSSLKADRITVTQNCNPFFRKEKILIRDVQDCSFFGFCSIHFDGSVFEWISHDEQTASPLQIFENNPYDLKLFNGELTSYLMGKRVDPTKSRTRPNAVQIDFLINEGVSCKVREEDVIETEGIVQVDLPTGEPEPWTEEDIETPFIHPLESEERTILALQGQFRERSRNLIFFGYDGQTTVRRDAEVRLLSMEEITEAIRRVWSDMTDYDITPWLVTPQPDELQNEGISFILSLQYMYTAERVVSADEILTLNVMTMQTWNHEMELGEVTVYRGASMSLRINKAEVLEKQDLTSLCRPCGRRECQIFCANGILDDTSSCQLDNGALIRITIGPWNAIDDLRRTFQEVDMLISDINAAQERMGDLEVTFNMYGYRFLPLGKRTRSFLTDGPISCETLANQIGSAWMNQPIDRAKIFRARALEAEENRRITIHLLIGFDLRPGNALILAVGSTDLSSSEVLAGPELLPPHLWDLDFGGQAFRNPLSDRPYEILNTEDGSFAGQMRSGDVVFFVEPQDTAVEETSLLQQKSSFVSQSENVRSHNCEPKADELWTSMTAVSSSRKPLLLFPLLDNLSCDVGQPVPDSSIEAFLHACKAQAIDPTLPAVIFDELKPISKAYLETCQQSPVEGDHYCIYTDGAAFQQKHDGHSFKEATWAAVIFKVSNGARSFHGWTGGFVCTEPNERFFAGAAGKTAMDAERSAIFWLLAWSLSLPEKSSITFHVDNQSACYGAAGTWQIDMLSDLAVRTRELANFASDMHQIAFEHVKAHSLQPQNEMADVIATKIADFEDLLKHRNRISDACIAGFCEYKKLWFWRQRGKALPHIDHEGRVVTSPLESPQVVPPLLRQETEVLEEDPRTVNLDIQTASYNVLTLKPYDKSEKIDVASVYYGKASYLQKQMHESNIAVLAIQEGRSRTAGLFENADVIRIVTAGTEAGTHGVELWLSKSVPFGLCGKKKLFFNKSNISVREATPTTLIAHYDFGKHRFAFVVCHAPQTGQPDEIRKEWWQSLSSSIGKCRKEDILIVLGDLNARLPESVFPCVGDLVCQKRNGNTDHMLNFILAHNLYVPSTFSAHHHGPIETWCHTSGSMSRLDYVLIHQDQWTNFYSSAWPRLDVGNAVADHFAVALRLRAEWNNVQMPKPKKSIDWQKVRDPMNQKHLCEALTEIPLAPWHVHPTDQVHSLNHAIKGKLEELFPLKGARFRKPYVTEDIWSMRQQRCNLRALLRNMHRHFACEKGTLWLGFRRLAGRSCCSTKHFLVAPQLTTSLCVAMLRETAHCLKLKIKAARANYVEEVAKTANCSNTSQVFAELRKLGVNGKMRKRGTPPLPLWKTEDDQPTESLQERANLWQKRCSDLEAGIIVTPQQLLDRAHARQRQRIEHLEPPTLTDMPSVPQIEARLRTVKKNKACGNDLLKSEICSLGAAPLAKHVHAITSKFVTFLEEPLQWKGGTLIAAYKNSGRMDDVKNYRSLLLSDHLGKSMRSWARDRYRSLYAENSAQTHFAGKLGGNPSHASSLLRAFLNGAGAKGMSCSAYFVDVSSAYYRVIREMLIDNHSSDQEIIAILEHFSMGPKEFCALQEHLKTPPVLHQCTSSARDLAMMDSLLESTWFTVIGSSTVTRTRAGSRPGDTFADLIFAFIYSQLLQVMRGALEDSGFVTADQQVYEETLRSTTCQSIDMSQMIDVLDLTWADDLVILQANRDPRELVRRTTLVGGLLSDLCSRRGLQLNYKSGKTECLLRLKGKGSKQLRIELFADEFPLLRLPSTLCEDLKVRIVANYKHLGTQISLASSQLHEIKVRTGQARAVFNKHRKTVFQNPAVALPTRVRLLHVLVLSILNYNQGTWRPLNSSEWKYYQNAIMTMYRSLVRATVPFDEVQEWSHERICAFLETSTPQDLLHASRLRYLGSLWRGAPLVAWYFHHLEGTWFDAVGKAFEWMETNTAGLHDRAAADKRRASWGQIIQSPREWKFFINKATQHSIATSKSEELIHRWHFEFAEKLIEKGLQVDHSDLMIAGLYEDGLPARHKFGCLPCGVTFHSKAGWSVHAFRKHDRVAPERLGVFGTACIPCHKQYHTSQRLLRHLRHSQSCAAVMTDLFVEEQQVAPGKGSTRVDSDRVFPLPVLKLMGPETPTLQSHRVCRPTFSPHLFESLKRCVADSAPDISADNVKSCFDSCLAELMKSFDCSDDVLRTIEHFRDYYHNSEQIRISELLSEQLGRAVGTLLAQEVTFDKLFPEQGHEATPKELRGATYRAIQRRAGRNYTWRPKQTILRMRTRTLLIAHFFSGHRREGDVTSFLSDLPRPSGAIVVMLAIDIIYDFVRCDLARRESQIRWKAIARVGALLGSVLGPPCETFSVARSQGGIAGETTGDGGPRQVRSHRHPYGLPHTTVDERQHVHLGNALLFFSYDICIEQLVFPECFFILEHPSPPEQAADRDLPSSWLTGACQMLLSHPEVSLIQIQQGRFGAISPKPTSLLCKGVPSLQGYLDRIGVLPLPKALSMRKSDGLYSTAALKAYPERLCKSFGLAIRESLKAFCNSNPSCTCVDDKMEAWIQAIQENSNLLAHMGMDRAGKCDI